LRRRGLARSRARSSEGTRRPRCCVRFPNAHRETALAARSTPPGERLEGPPDGNGRCGSVKRTPAALAIFGRVRRQRGLAGPPRMTSIRAAMSLSCDAFHRHSMAAMFSRAAFPSRPPLSHSPEIRWRRSSGDCRHSSEVSQRGGQAVRQDRSHCQEAGVSLCTPCRRPRREPLSTRRGLVLPPEATVHGRSPWTSVWLSSYETDGTSQPVV
jgi:hypothetical protein